MAHKNNEVVVSTIKAGLEMAGGIEAIEQGVNKFMEGSKVLMDALDGVAKLHPFIGGKKFLSRCIFYYILIF